MDFAVVVGLHGRRLHEQFAFLNLQKSAMQVKYAHPIRGRAAVRCNPSSRECRESRRSDLLRSCSPGARTRKVIDLLGPRRHKVT
jgi:hypothetical protein